MRLFDDKSNSGLTLSILMVVGLFLMQPSEAKSEFFWHKKPADSISAENERFKSHVEALHSKLHLNTQQEAAWNIYINQLSSCRAYPQNFKAWNEITTSPEQIDTLIQFRTNRLEALKQYAVALKTFYAQLDTTQQGIFDEFILGDKKHPQERGK
jgi:LTXXQ motif family protein